MAHWMVQWPSHGGKIIINNDVNSGHYVCLTKYDAVRLLCYVLLSMYFYVLLCTLYFLLNPCRLLQTWQAAAQPTCTIVTAADLRPLFLVPVHVSAKELCCEFLPSKGLASLCKHKGGYRVKLADLPYRRLILTYLSPNNKPTSVCLCPGTFQAL